MVFDIKIKLVVSFFTLSPSQIMSHDYDVSEQPEKIVGDQIEATASSSSEVGIKNLTPFSNNRILLTFKKCFTCEDVNFNR